MHEHIIVPLLKLDNTFTPFCYKGASGFWLINSGELFSLRHFDSLLTLIHLNMVVVRSRF